MILFIIDLERFPELHLSVRFYNNQLTFNNVKPLSSILCSLDLRLKKKKWLFVAILYSLWTYVSYNL